jgi:hypothetical protein
MKNQKFNTHKIKQICESKLEIDFRTGGKEFNGWFWLDDKKVNRITVSKGRKFVPPKTYTNMAKQLNLTTSEFDDLLECPLEQAAYIEILRERLD